MNKNPSIFIPNFPCWVWDVVVKIKIKGVMYGKGRISHNCLLKQTKVNINLRVEAQWDITTMTSYTRGVKGSLRTSAVFVFYRRITSGIRVPNQSIHLHYRLADQSYLVFALGLLSITIITYAIQSNVLPARNMYKIVVPLRRRYDSLCWVWEVDMIVCVEEL